MHMSTSVYVTKNNKNFGDIELMCVLGISQLLLRMFVYSDIYCSFTPDILSKKQTRCQSNGFH